jgi:hypothetical protein
MLLNPFINRYRVFVRIALVLMVTMFFLTCSLNYKPASDWEKREFENARFDVYPEDIRENLAEYKTTEVAWAGIIQVSERYENPNSQEFALLMEHRYFDWKPTYRNSNIIYHPSASGEGLFQTSWFLKKDADLDFYSELYAPENLALVYGVPDTVINDVVFLKCKYIRIIKKGDFFPEYYNYVPEGRAPYVEKNSE